MTSAGLELQKGDLSQTLTADAPLSALLGGGRVYDDVPQRAELPYVTFGQSSTRDWSTGTDDGHEHVVDTSRSGRVLNGRKEVHRIIGCAGEVCCTSRRSVLTDHAYRQSAARVLRDARRDPDGETSRGAIAW